MNPYSSHHPKNIIKFLFNYLSIFSNSDCAGINKDGRFVVYIDDGNVHENFGGPLNFSAAIDCQNVEAVFCGFGGRQIRI